MVAFGTIVLLETMLLKTMKKSVIEPKFDSAFGLAIYLSIRPLLLN